MICINVLALVPTVPGSWSRRDNFVRKSCFMNVFKRPVGFFFTPTSQG